MCVCVCACSLLVVDFGSAGVQKLSEECLSTIVLVMRLKNERAKPRKPLSLKIYKVERVDNIQILGEVLLRFYCPKLLCHLCAVCF